MAFNVTSNYSGKAFGQYISAALKEAKSLEGLTVLENIKYKENIRKMAGSTLVKDATEEVKKSSKDIPDVKEQQKITKEFYDTVIAPNEEYGPFKFGEYNIDDSSGIQRVNETGRPVSVYEHDLEDYLQIQENEIENNIAYLHDVKKSIEKLISSLEKEVN